MKMTEDDLKKLEEKTKWSGFDRKESTRIILDLITLVRYQRDVILSEQLDKERREKARNMLASMAKEYSEKGWS